jgi:hypothetical protein
MVGWVPHSGQIDRGMNLTSRQINHTETGERGITFSFNQSRGHSENSKGWTSMDLTDGKGGHGDMEGNMDRERIGMLESGVMPCSQLVFHLELSSSCH